MRLALAIAALVPVTAAAARPPAFTFSGPYGDPFAVELRRGSSLPAGGMPSLARPGRPEEAARVAPTGLPGAAGKAGGREPAVDEDEDDDPLPAKPGTFPTTFMKVPDPTPYLKKRTMGPHLRPDAEFDLDERTTLGVIGQMDRLRTGTTQLTTGRMPTIVTARSTPSPAHGRDLGFGATLEFKLGQ